VKRVVRKETEDGARRTRRKREDNAETQRKKRKEGAREEGSFGCGLFKTKTSAQDDSLVGRGNGWGRRG
jgi:hypothetical protein